MSAGWRFDRLTGVALLDNRQGEAVPVVVAGLFVGVSGLVLGDRQGGAVAGGGQAALEGQERGLGRGAGNA